MKKVLLAAFAALAITSCSQNEELDGQSSNNEIKVGTVVKNSTRAAILDNTSFKAFTLSSFIVASNIDLTNDALGNSYMNEIGYTGSKADGWTTSGKYYWPSTDNVLFFAWAPEAQKTSEKQLSIPATGLPKLTYTIGATADVQKDIVVAALNSAKPVNDNDAITLDFKHILTKINFSYKPEANYEDYAYDITDLKITGMKGGEAIYTFASDVTKGVWTAGTDVTGGYVYNINKGVKQADGFYPLDAVDGSLMLLPQTFAKDIVKIVLSYSVENKTTKYTYTANNVEIPIPASTWDLGQNLRYKLTLPAGKGEIKLETSDLNWNNETPTPAP